LEPWFLPVFNAGGGSGLAMALTGGEAGVTSGRKKTPAKKKATRKKVARKKTSRKERPEAIVAPGVLTVSLGGFGFEEEVWAPDEVDLTAILKAGRSGKIPDPERSNTDFNGIFLNSGRRSSLGTRAAGKPTRATRSPSWRTVPNSAPWSLEALFGEVEN
jgi:hypothetical protein